MTRGSRRGINEKALPTSCVIGRASIGVAGIELGPLELHSTLHHIPGTDNAAGWGWFVDPTPRNDSEFRATGDQGERKRIDLLSLLTHEFGHLLGHDHAEGGAMAETLPGFNAPFSYSWVGNGELVLQKGKK